MRVKIILIFFFLLLIAYDCSIRRKAVNQPVINFTMKYSPIPAGVDSIVAHNSKIKAERLFVNMKREQAADSLIKYYSEYLEITEELYNLLETKKEDFKKVRQSYNELKKGQEEQNPLLLEERRKYEKLLQGIAEDSLTISIVTSLLDYYLDYCYENFQQAYKLNPFHLNGLQYLARCNWDRGVIFEDTLAYRHAIQSLMKILTYDRGVASIYKEIGKNYFRLKQWELAHKYLSKAKDIYVITSVFEDQKPKLTGKYERVNLPKNIDPLTYYDYLYRKGMAEIKVYKADSALATFKEAFVLAPTKQDSNHIATLVKEWIEWDDGNIYGAEQKHIIQDSLDHGNYEWAKNAYLKLIPQLKTNKARDNISWQLARIEHLYLDQSRQAADRLYNLVVHADTSMRKTNIYKAPEDSLYKVYFKDCGDILYGLGNTYKDQGLYNEARQFFIKDTTFDWDGREKVFLHLAQLVGAEIPEDIPPEERFKLANERRLTLLNRARIFVEKFTDKEIDLLYRPLIQIYRQRRDMEKANFLLMEYRQHKERLKNKS